MLPPDYPHRLREAILWLGDWTPGEIRKVELNRNGSLLVSFFEKGYVYATPFWDQPFKNWPIPHWNDLPLEFLDEEGDPVGRGGTSIRVFWTGDLIADVRLWASIVDTFREGVLEGIQGK